MAQTVLLKRSSVAGNVPGSSDLALGEIAVNTADGAVYIKKGNNDIVAVADNDILHIDTTNSRVGIGLTNPAATFQVNGSIVSEGGSFTSGIETASDVGIVIQKNDYIYSDDNNYLRKIIGHTSTNHIEIGQSNTVYIADINLRPGSSGNIRFFTSGSEDITFTSAGHVGIGTTSPTTPLEVKSTGNTAIRISTDGDATDKPQLQLFRNAGAYSQIHYEADGGGNAGLHITDFRNDSNSHIIFNTKGDNERMRIESDGKVGIGTTSPLDLLHIKSSTTDARQVIDGHTGYDAELKFAENGTVKYTIGHDAATDNFVIGTTNVDTQQRLVIDSSGNVGIGTTTPGHQLHLNSTQTIPLKLSSTSTSGTGIYIDNDRTGSKLFGILVGNIAAGAFSIKDEDAGATRFVINSSGSITFNEAYTFPTADGSANQVLQTDGSGNLSFATVSGGGGVTISNNADNRVLTGDGTNANAEANLTFDGTNLTTTGAYIADTHFRSSDGNATLSATGSGGVYLRPNGYNSTTAQFIVEATTGNVTAAGKLYLSGQSNNYLQHDSDTLRAVTSHGYIQLGPANTGHAHLMTDRSNFYFNVGLQVNSGIIASYDEDLILRRARDTSYELTLKTTGLELDQGTMHLKSGLYSASNTDVKLRQYYLSTTDSGGSFLLGKIENSANSDGAVEGIVRFAYDYGSTSNNCAIHFNFAQRSGTARGTWWYEHDDQEGSSDRVHVRLIDDGAGNMYVWATCVDYAKTYIETTWRQCTSVSDSGTLTAGTLTTGTTLFDTANDPTSEHHIGRLYAHNDIYLLDNKKVYYGNSNDLQIYHDNTDSLIRNYTGDLVIQNDANDKDIIFRSDDGSGGVATYFQLDGGNGYTSIAKKFLFQDNVRADFGNDSDLYIQHTGSESQIFNTTGQLDIRSSTRILLSSSAGENMARFTNNGAAELFYDNAVKLATKSDGVDITGELQSDSLDVDGNADISGNLVLGGNLTVNGTSTTLNTATLDVEDKNITLNKGSGDTSGSADGAGITIQDAVDASNDATILWDATNDEFDFSHGITLPDSKSIKLGDGPDLQIYHDGSNSYIANGGNGNLRLTNGTGNIELRASTIALQDNSAYNYLRAEDLGNGGRVRIYHEGSQVMMTESTGIDVTGTTVTDGLTVNSGGTSSFLSIRNGSNNSFTKLYSDLNGVTVLDVDANNVGSAPRFQIDVSEVQALRITEGGDISFYEDTGTTAKLLWDASADSLNFVDNAKAQFGTSNDLQIYSTGSFSYIKELGTGGLYLDTNGDGIYLRGTTGNKNMVRAIKDGAVTLYHDGDIKAATTSTGIDVTGTISSTYLTSSSTDVAITRPIQVYHEGGGGATSGGIFLRAHYSGDTSLGSLSSEYSSGEPMFGSGMAYKSGAAGIVSTFANFSDERSGIKVNRGSVVFTGTSGAVQTAVGSALTVVDTFTHNTTNGDTSITGSLTIPNKIIHSGDTDTYLSFANADDFRIVAGNSTRAAFNTSKIHFNQEGINQDFQVEGQGTGNESLLYVDASANKVGIGTTPGAKLHVNSDTTLGWSNLANAFILAGTTSAGIGIDNNEIMAKGSGALYFGTSDSGNDVVLRAGGTAAAVTISGTNQRVGISKSTPLARFQVEEYGIDTTETSTTATTQVAIHSFPSTSFRSARFTVQVTNSTDSTYHTTELLMVHDGTTANITEFGEIHTGSAVEATFDADISSGNVRLLATPASTDTMAFKVVCHSITT